MLPLCRAEGLGVIPWSPLARGRLARPSKVTRQQATTRATSDDFGNTMYEGEIEWDTVDAVERIATARGVAMSEIALAWLLSRPGITAPIVGATKPTHLQDAIKAVDIVLTPEEIHQLEAPYRPHRVLGH